jgi:cAMP-dependent protein kinase regulator
MKDLIREHKERAAEFVVRGRIPEAIREYGLLLQKVPGDHAQRHRLADLLARSGNTAAAVAEYQRVAGAYAKDGQLLKAVAVSKVILNLDPRQTSTRDALADLYAQRLGNAGPRTVEVPVAMAAMLRAPAAPASPPPSALVAVTSSPSEELLVPDDVVDDDVLLEISVDLSESEEFQLEQNAFPRIPLFSDLSHDEFIALSDGLQMRQVEPGQVIVQEGDPGDSMFAIVQGAVGVVRGTGASARQVDSMAEGAFFGEMALLTRSPRLASIVALDACTLLELSRPTMEEVTARHPSVTAALERFYKERLLANLMRSNAFFQALTDVEKPAVLEALRPWVVQPGEVVLAQGAVEAHFYLLLRGRCRAFLKTPDGLELDHAPLEEGSFMGENSMVLGLPSIFTVTADALCVVLHMEMADFMRLLWPNEKARAHLCALAQQRMRATAELLDPLTS